MGTPINGTVRVEWRRIRICIEKFAIEILTMPQIDDLVFSPKRL
jgi:hypothetical protein